MMLQATPNVCCVVSFFASSYHQLHSRFSQPTPSMQCRSVRAAAVVEEEEEGEEVAAVAGGQ